MQYHVRYPATPVRAVQIKNHLFHLEILGSSARLPPVNSDQDPTEVSFVGKSMPTPLMAIEAVAYAALARLRFAVPYASEWGYYYFPSRAAPEGVTSFSGG